MILGFKGTWSYKQFNSSKPKKYHIKSFGRVDSTTGYVLNLLTYYGSDCDPDSGIAIKIFDTLLMGLALGTTSLPTGSTQLVHLWTTWWPRIFITLARTNRKNFSPQLKTQRLAHMASTYQKTSDEKILCMSKDKKAKKCVSLVTMCAAVESVLARGRNKPAAIHTYNQYMNGCDQADQNLGYYGVQDHRSTKWWKELYFWAIEIGQLSAFILYKIMPHRNRESSSSLSRVSRMQLSRDL
ncbi:PiggyBac transposable element-derived protein 4 [Plakobranchus ocellatus]|uniref:PiggyBac transposable element-derived protein 4 n=1 Tax=Plakobranchus ocellatus TaxID=259542 RepID=A0AAV3Y6W9_9GAST|nr:PiggyBac transposable element-derived protein 4 [Plakobranchus ocellatus]